METTKLSSKGQIIIPKRLREEYNWQAGVEFIVINTGNGILLRPKNPFPETTIEEVTGCLTYDGPPISITEMDEAISRRIREESNVRR
jgi:AbrB family looped-hinge helix DNA binding protein